MTYPNSSDVAAGQPTASAHYNNLRKDALYLGNVAADSVSLGSFMQSFVLNIELEYLATSRVRVPYDSQKPATIMISGCMLLQNAAIDLAASSFSGAAATWYIFANRTAGVTSFTLSVNTSPVPAADQRLIGECYWNGTSLVATSIYSYSQGGDVRLPDYDSGWYSVAYNQTYVKTHNLGQVPRELILYWSSTNDGSTARYPVYVATHTSSGSVVYCDVSNIYTKTASSSTAGTLYSTNTVSGGGYYRILAWV